MSFPALPDLSGRGLEVAPRLLGCVLATDDAAIRIVEVEAYEGSDDPASHAFRGLTRRNAIMFGPPGHLYVYQLHGHACANIVCGPEGVATAVLVRAGEVIAGLDAARARRPGVPDSALAQGPGNLCRALGLTASDNGVDLATGRVRLLPPDAQLAPWASGRRVNVAHAATRLWRFWTPSASVSAYKRHPKADVGQL